MTKKLLIILLIVVIGGGVVIGGTFAWRYWQTLEEEEEPEVEVPADWKTYSNPGVNFTFKYPLDWEIKEEYQYKSAACQIDPKCKGVHYIFLNKIDDPRLVKIEEKEKFGIVINMPQCTGVKWSELPGDSWVCVFDEDPEVLNIYEQIRISFKLVEDETADWETYRNEEYGFEVKYPQNWEMKEQYDIDQGILIAFDIMGYQPTDTEAYHRWYPLTIKIQDQEILGGKNIREWLEDKEDITLRINIIGTETVGNTPITIAKLEEIAMVDVYYGAYMILNDFVYSIVVGESQDFARDSKVALDQILSTFRFIE